MDAIRSMRLAAVRCTVCGETRWSLFSSVEQALARPCEMCGGETELERRRPGSGPRGLPLERERRAAGPQQRQAGVTSPGGGRPASFAG